MDYDVAVFEHVWIPLPDGRRLAARMWLPESEGSVPAILEYLPYRKRDGTAPRDATTHPVFAGAGYGCVRVDIAGTGDSDGLFDDEYSERELTDGEHVLAWIANQDWCDGQVGMIGISWGGFNGLQLAYRRPPALKAVVSVASTVDRYADDIHYMGGCLLSDNFNWSNQMFAYQTRPPDPLLRPDWREEWIRRMNAMPMLAADWLHHPARDDYWKHGSVCEDWSAITAPVLAMTGWADAYVNAPPALAAGLKVPVKAMIGPWEHRYAHLSVLEPADFHAEVLRWFDRWLKNQPNDAENLPDYRTYMQEYTTPTSSNTPRKGRWIAEPTWPSPNVSTLTLAPGDHGLSPRPQTGSVTICSPTDTGEASGHFCPGMRIDHELPGDQAPDDARSVCFDTPPLDEPLELLGRPELEIRFSVNRPTAQIVARLCDVSPEGESFRITYRALNLAHHASHETPEPLIPGRVYTTRLLLNECAHRLRRGQRLRLALSSSYWPVVWPTPARTEVTLDLADCRLHLPVRRVQDEPEPKSPAPARQFPWLETKTLREHSGTTRAFIDDQGYRVLEFFDDFGKDQDPEHKMIIGSHVTMWYKMRPDDPASACAGASWNFTFERGDWQIEIDTESRMSGDAGNFYLLRRLHATEGVQKTEVLTREWSTTVPRKLL